jgi:hypothetical protein
MGDFIKLVVWFIYFNKVKNRRVNSKVMLTNQNAG